MHIYVIRLESSNYEVKLRARNKVVQIKQFAGSIK